MPRCPWTPFWPPGEPTPFGYKRYSYSMRSGFHQVREVALDDALRAAVPAAKTWLSARDDLDVPPGTVANEAALDRFAEMLEEGMDPGVHGLMTGFAIRVGARRLVDAATAMTRIGLAEASAVLDAQARLVGSLQYELTAGSAAAAAAIVRKLKPTYAELARLL